MITTIIKGTSGLVVKAGHRTTSYHIRITFRLQGPEVSHVRMYTFKAVHVHVSTI